MLLVRGHPSQARSRHEREEADDTGACPGADPDAAPEKELAQLVREVRKARERLAQLIRTVQAERNQWPEREERWERLRTDTQRVMNKPAAVRDKSKVH